MYVLIRTIKIVLDGEATAESMALDTGIRTLFPVHLPKDTRSCAANTLSRTASQTLQACKQGTGKYVRGSWK